MIEYPGSNSQDQGLNPDSATKIPGTPNTIPMTGPNGTIDSGFVDQGNGSGFDADTVDGYEAFDLLDWKNFFNKPSPSITLVGDVTGTTNLLELMSGEIYAVVTDNSHRHKIENIDNLQSIIDAKISIDNIVNNLVTSDTESPLSAEQGRVLKDLIDGIQSYLNTTSDDIALIQDVVDFVNQNSAALNALTIANIAGLQDALDNKVDNSRVLTDVPAGAKFTDVVYDDTRLDVAVTGLKEVAHTHTNKDILDQTSAVYTGQKDDLVATIPSLQQGQIDADNEFTSLHNLIQSNLNTNNDQWVDIADIKGKLHEHSNKSVLDGTTVSFTTAYKDKINASAQKLSGIEDNATADQTKDDINALKINAKTVNGYTVKSNVPVDAKFTDTVYELPVADVVLGGIVDGGDINIDVNGIVTVKQHNHDISEINGLRTELDSKRDSSVKIPTNDITGLDDKLDSKRNISDNLEINDINNLNHVLNLKRNLNDDVDASEVTGLSDLLNLKRDLSDKVVIQEIAGLQTELNSKREKNVDIKLNEVQGLNHELSLKRDLLDDIAANEVQGLSNLLDLKRDKDANIDINEINNLNNRLNQARKTSDDIPVSDIIGLQAQLDSKCDSADGCGGGEIGDITGLQALLDAKRNVVDPLGPDEIVGLTNMLNAKRDKDTDIETSEVAGLEDYIKSFVGSGTGSGGTVPGGGGISTGVDGSVQLGNGLLLQWGYVSNYYWHNRHWIDVYFPYCYDNATIGVWTQSINDDDKTEIKSLYHGGFQMKFQMKYRYHDDEYIIWYSLGY